MKTPSIPHPATMCLTVLVLLAACGAPPEILQMEVDPRPSEAVPLAARLMLTTDTPTTVVLEIDDGQTRRSLDARAEPSTNHSIPILGLRPGRTETLRVRVTDESGRSMLSSPVELARDPLPEDFPPIEVRVSIPDRMERGFTLIEPSFSPADGSQRENQWLIAVDPSGDVVWYYMADHGVSDAQRLPNGHFLYRSGNTHLYEIDVLGNVIFHWTAELTPEDQRDPSSIKIPTDTLHHEALETPWGNIMALSTEVRSIDNYPTSDTDPDAPRAASNVVGDVIVEFTRQGEIVREIRTLDLFDPYRIGYGSLGGFWRGTYDGMADQVRDWSHANGISLDETGRYLLLSMRHQGAVAKIDLEINEVVWILADPRGWGPRWQDRLLEPVGDLTWPADQHAPMFTPDGTILMFDNGTNRALPFDPPMPAAESYSRAVEYAVDEETMQVREVWSYGGPGDERYYAWRVGDADWLRDTGNVLLTYGGMSLDEEGNTISRAGHNWIRVVEVTHEMPAEKVFELFVDDTPPRGWLSFQGERLGSLYPERTGPQGGGRDGDLIQP